MSAVRPALRLAVGAAHDLLPLPGGDLLITTAAGELKRLGPEGPRWSLDGVAPAQASLTALPGGLVAVWGKDQKLKIVDPSSQELTRTLDHGRGWGDNGVAQVEVLGADQLLTCDSQGLLRGWSLETGKAKELRREMRTPKLLGRFPDGRWVLSGSQIHILSVDAAKLERSFIAGATGVVAAAFTAAGALALANEFGKVSVWSAEGRKLGERDMGGYEAVSGVSALEDGGLLAWGEGGQLWVLDGQAKLRFKLEGHRGEVERVVLLDDGSAVSGGQDPELRLWDLDPDADPGGRALGVLEGHSGPNAGLMALPGGRALSWAGPELKLWSGDPPRLLASLDGHKGAILGARRLDDGALVSWSEDGELLRWPSQDGRAASRPKRAPAPPPAPPKAGARPPAPPKLPPSPPPPPAPELPPKRLSAPPPPAPELPPERLSAPPPPPEPPRLQRELPPPAPRIKTPADLSAELDAELSRFSARSMEPEAPLVPQGQNLAMRYAIIGAVVGFMFCTVPGLFIGGFFGWKIGKTKDRGY